MKKINLEEKSKSYKTDILKVANSNLEETLDDLEINNSLYQYTNREERVKKFKTNTTNFIHFNFFKEFFSSFIEPFNLLLMLIGFIELALYFFYAKVNEELVGACLIFFMVLLAVVTDFIQEIKSYKINKNLYNLVENNYWLVKTDVKKISEFDLKNIYEESVLIKEEELTVGDLIYLAAGDVVPADCKIIWSENLNVDQSQLTGESILIKKESTYRNCDNFIDYTNILYGQSQIKSGKCLVLVVKVGENKFDGIIAKYVSDTEVKTDFDKGISKLTKIILLIIFLAFAVIMIASSFKTGDWVNGAIFGITIVVALTPEALPAILSGNLQLGSKILSKHKVVVKDFSIIQNLGSVNVLATDKTGTLTNEKVKLDIFHDYSGHQHNDLMNYFYLNAINHNSTTNAIDLAIVDAGKKLNLDISDYILLAEEEFDYEKRISSVVLKNKITKKIIKITKGSIEEVLKITTKINNDKKVIELDEVTRKNILQDIIEHSNNGQRSILLATKEIENDHYTDLNDMTLEGFAIFSDTLKEGVSDAIKNIYENNVNIKILSGDTLEVCQNIAKQINFKSVEGVSGNNLIEHDHDVIEEKTIFSKLNPVQKGDVVNCLHENNHVIGYLGDGVNDALALRMSDVGISVNNGSVAAKQAADIIMLEKDLDVLNNAFILGRRVFYNAIKFIKLTVATNLGLMLTILITSLWFSFRSMLPIQLLIQNLLFDFSNLFFIFDKVDNISIKKPMKWNIRQFVPFILSVGAVSCLTSIMNLMIVGYGFDFFNDVNNNLNHQQMLQTIFFIESFVTHMVVVFVCRTEKIAFFQSNTSFKMFIGILVLFLILLGLVYIPKVNDLFSLVPPKPIWWAIMIGVSISTWFLLEMTKLLYKRVYKSWI